MPSDYQHKARFISVFALIMITVGSVNSIRNLPTAALFGSTLIFFFLIGALLFLLPTSLVSAELASTWPEQGGIYVWVRKAFGPKVAFFAIWFQWIENVIWYPTILSFMAATLGYLVSPSLANNKFFLITVIFITFWGATFINLHGMKTLAKLTVFCTITGLLIPMSLIITLGIVWFVLGKPIQMHFDWVNMIPHFNNPAIWVALTGIMTSFCGIEIATVHARDVKNPQTSFPKALIISMIIILITLIFASLSIAMVIPANKMSLVAGIMQAYHAFFVAFHLSWALPIIAVMMVLGGLGGVSNWIVAPTKALLISAEDGNIPKWMAHENKHGAPNILLILQAIIVTILISVFLLMPSVNGSYWLLVVLTAQLYMFMYLIMFISAIYLRHKFADHKRVFQIPGGKWGTYLVCTVGIIGTLLTIAIGFIPPENINVGGKLHYEILLIIGLSVMSLPPFLIHRRRKKINLS